MVKTNENGEGADAPLNAEELTIKEAAALLNKTERSVQRYIQRFDLPFRTVHTQYGKRTLIVRAAIERLAERLAEEIASTIPHRRYDDPMHPPAERDTDGAGGAGSHVDEPGLRRNDAVDSKEASLLAVPRLSVQELRALLSSAIAEGVKRALEEADVSRVSPCAGDHSAGVGRWTLFTGAALVTAMAVVAVAIMQHTLAIA